MLPHAACCSERLLELKQYAGVLLAASAAQQATGAAGEAQQVAGAAGAAAAGDSAMQDAPWAPGPQDAQQAQQAQQEGSIAAQQAQQAQQTPAPSPSEVVAAKRAERTLELLCLLVQEGLVRERAHPWRTLAFFCC